MNCDPITAAERTRQRRKLTPKQDQVLRALVLFTHRHRRQPSYRELAQLVGVSQVHKYLVDLEARGWIRLGGGPRAIEIPIDVYDSIVDTGEAPATGDTDTDTKR